MTANYNYVPLGGGDDDSMASYFAGQDVEYDEALRAPVLLGAVARPVFAAYTGTRSVQVYCLAREEGYSGVTAATVAMDTNLRIEDAKRILENLHRAGYLARLAKERMGSGVYVLPEDVDGRPTTAYEARRPATEWDDEDIEYAIAVVGADLTVEQAKRLLQVLT
jgi:hypothetical protein